MTSLAQHRKEEHNISPFSTYLKEIVYGGTDGIVTTFAVVAGFAGAGQEVAGSIPVLSVLLFGFANLFGDGVSMAFGSFLSARSEQDVYKSEKAKEVKEVRENVPQEKEETHEILTQKGFTTTQAETLTEIFATNKKYWVEFMMQYELGMSNPDGENPAFISLATFSAFIVCGLLPLVPFLFFLHHPNAFYFSVFTTAGALICLGYFRYKVTRRNIWKSIGESLVLGSLAASVAYGVGVLFRI